MIQSTQHFLFRHSLYMTVFAIFLIFAWNETVLAHGGVDDETPASQPMTSSNDMLTAVAYPDTAEIFVKYAPPKVGAQSTLKFFFSSFRSDIPFNPDKIQIELLGGKGEVLKQPVKKENGVYEAVITFQSDTIYTIRLTYTIGGESMHANIVPIFVGTAALKVLQNEGKAIAPSTVSNNAVWWVIAAMVLLAAAFYYTIQRKKKKRTSILVKQ